MPRVVAPLVGAWCRAMTPTLRRGRFIATHSDLSAIICNTTETGKTSKTL